MPDRANLPIEPVELAGNGRRLLSLLLVPSLHEAAALFSRAI